MTEYEEEYREQYEKALELLSKKVRQNRTHIMLLERDLLDTDLNWANSLDEVKAKLHDVWTTAGLIDGLYEDGVLFHIEKLLRLHSKIYNEVHGDKPEPMGGHRERDFM